LLIQYFYWPGKFGTVIGAWFVGFGLVGFARGKITVGGRGGSRTYVGPSAYAWSFVFIVIGMLSPWVADRA